MPKSSLAEQMLSTRLLLRELSRMIPPALFKEQVLLLRVFPSDDE